MSWLEEWGGVALTGVLCVVVAAYSYFRKGGQPSSVVCEECGGSAIPGPWPGGYFCAKCGRNRPSGG